MYYYPLLETLGSLRDGLHLGYMGGIGVLIRDVHIDLINFGEIRLWNENTCLKDLNSLIMLSLPMILYAQSTAYAGRMFRRFSERLANSNIKNSSILINHQLPLLYCCMKAIACSMG
jgi:hypothetical protein